MARKKPHAEHPDERWLLTYADMITLLMALFMVLYAMSSVSTAKFEVLKLTLHQTFSSAVFDGGSSILDRGAVKSSASTPNSEISGKDSQNIGDSAFQPTPKTSSQQQQSQAQQAHAARVAAAAATADRTQDADLRRAEQQIRQAIARTHLGSSVHIVQDRANGIVIIRLVSDRVLFDLGSWQLKPAGKPLLTGIAHSLERLPNTITVDGYTDALPLNAALGNDALSANRAIAVLQYLQAQGFDAPGHQTYAIPHGSRDPWKPNGPDGANPLNRRVEIHILRIHYGTGRGQTTPPPLGPAIPTSDMPSSPLSP